MNILTYLCSKNEKVLLKLQKLCLFGEGRQAPENMQERNALTLFLPTFPFDPPENIRKPRVF